MRHVDGTTPRPIARPGQSATDIVVDLLRLVPITQALGSAVRKQNSRHHPSGATEEPEEDPGPCLGRKTNHQVTGALEVSDQQRGWELDR